MVKDLIIWLLILLMPIVYLRLKLHMDRLSIDQKREYPMQRCEIAAKRARRR